MGSIKIKTQGHSQGHVTLAFMCFFKEKNPIKIDLVYI